MALTLAVALLGGLGAVARYSVSLRLPGPRGTLLVNLTGTFALGVLDAAGVTGAAYTLAGTAVLGSFTTFSTWMLEAGELPPRRGAAYIAVALLAGLVAVGVPRLV